MKLKKQVAVVTGAGSGQGRATAVLFAQEGAAVVAADISAENAADTAAEITRSGGKALPFSCDMRRADDVEALMQAAADHFGGIHILVNSVGVNFFGGAEETAEKDWDKVVDTNLKSVYLSCKFAVPHMRKSGGSIVNIGSISGMIGQRQHIAYCASKAGVINMTKALALDYASQGIRVNCVCPGGVRTPMLFELIDPNNAAEIRRVEQLHPLNRLAEPEEMAGINLFLCSKDAAFITGAIIVADGGSIAGQIMPVNTGSQ